MITSEKIDHLVYACSDLTKGIAEIEKLTGAKVSPGGIHQGRGTHNALLSLGEKCYLEIIAADPMQTEVERPLWMGLDGIKKSKLTRWSAKSSKLTLLQQQANDFDFNIGSIQEGQRQLPNGEFLQWELSDPKACPYDGAIPFFIDWKESTHPEENLPKECELLHFQISHPQGKIIDAFLTNLGLQVEVISGSTPGMTATIKTPHGTIVLS